MKKNTKNDTLRIAVTMESPGKAILPLLLLDISDSGIRCGVSNHADAMGYDDVVSLIGELANGYAENYFQAHKLSKKEKAEHKQRILDIIEAALFGKSI